MKKYLVTSALLLSLSFLSACGSDRPEWLGGEAKRPAADVVIGAKRAPALNPSPYQPVPTAMPPVPPKAPPAIDTAPYEYYDDQQQPQYYAPPPPPAMPAPDPRARNAFPVDPAYSTETVAVAPVPPAFNDPAELKPSPEMQAVISDTPPPMVEETTQHSWFSRMHERLSGSSDTPVAEIVKDEPYPKLSDVPKRPKQLETVQATQAHHMNELEADHVQAQEQRAMLAAEPSQTESAETLLGHAYEAKQGTVIKTVATPETKPVAIPVAKKAASPSLNNVSFTNDRPTLYDLQRTQEQALY